jgi:hypothetical protein
MKSIKELIESHTNEEGQIDYEKADASYQKHINDIVAAKTDPDKLATKAVDQIASELGIEAKSLDDVKLYIKKMGGNTDEIKETNMKLEKELEAIRKEKEDIHNEYQTFKGEYTTKDQLNMIKSLGLDEERAEFLHFKLNKQVGEDKDFNAVFEEYKNEHADEFKQSKTNFRKVPGSVNNPPGEDDIYAAWESKYGKK